MAHQAWDPAKHPFWHGAVPMPHVLETAGPDEMFVRGDGCWLVDAAGRRYLDARSGIGNMILGYSRDDIVEAMRRQASDLPYVCTMRYERTAPVLVDYAQALVDAAPGDLTRVHFTHTGSSAVEWALTVARRYHRNLGRDDRFQIVGLNGGFHGTTLKTMAAAGQPMLHEVFGPMPEGFHHVPTPDAASCAACREEPGAQAECARALVSAIEEIGAERVAAIVMEPVLGLSGVPLPGHYLTAVREYCTRQDILLVFDEVFTGFGRMGSLFAADLSGVTPDLMCVSKAMTAGYAPLGGVLANDKVYESFNSPATFMAPASTTDAHPVSCAAGMATLTALRSEDLVTRGRRMGERLVSTLGTLLDDSPRVQGVRGLGAHVAIDLEESADHAGMMETRRQLQAACEQRGVLIDYSPYAVLLNPPFTLSDADSDHLSEIVSDVIRTSGDSDIDPAALRPPSVSGRR